MENFINIFKNIFRGIHNIFIYIPILYQDRNWDHHYFLELMRFKLIRMKKFFETANICVEDENSAKEIDEVINLLNNIISDNYFSEEYDEIVNKYDHLYNIKEKNNEITNIYMQHFNKCELQKIADTKLVFDLLNQNLEKWWN